MDYINVTPEKLYEAFQKAIPEERKPVLKLIEKYAIIMDEADIKMALLDMVERVYHPQNALLRRWLENATTSSKGEHPRYVEGKGIYVPIIGKYLAMKDIFDGEEVNWDNAVRVAVPSRDEWYIILFFKDEINRLLRENGGEELDKWYWTSTENSEKVARVVNASNGNVGIDYKGNQYSVRAWVTTKALGYDARK